MNDRFKFRVVDNRDWSNKKGTIYYDAEETYDFMCGKPIIPASCFGNLLDDDWIVEQCTGLKDKNGKLVYEGDIVTDGQDNGRIYWENTGWACTMFLWQKKPEELEVIGNIHENKELLK